MSSSLNAIASIGMLVLGLGAGAMLTLAINRFPVPQTENGAPSAPPARPWRGLIVPAISALGFLLAYLQFGLSWRLLEACAFICVMIVIAFIDLDHMIIPNVIVLPAALLGLAASIALDPSRWWVYLIAAVGSSLFLFVLALLWPGGMGMGDVKLALLMGAVLGAAVLVAFFLAFLFGAIVGLVLILSKRKGRKDAIPFGPYLALGSVIALLYGPWMLDSYLGILG